MRYWIVCTAVFTGAVLAGQPAWATFIFDQSEGPFVVKYDFDAHDNIVIIQPENVITEAQKAQAVLAFDAWSAATDVGFGPNLVFVQDTNPSESNYIWVRTTNFGAPASTLGIGAGSIVHESSEPGSPFVGATGFGAAMNANVTWDATPDDGTDSGKRDYFSVAASEIGHALSLGHNNSSPLNIMHSSYTGTRTELSASDIIDIRAVWGVGALNVPEPSSLVLMGLGFVMLGVVGMRSRRRRMKSMNQCRGRISAP